MSSCHTAFVLSPTENTKAVKAVINFGKIFLGLFKELLEIYLSLLV